MSGTRADGGDLAETSGGRVIAVDRDETEPCEALTPGCCINHMLDDGDCEVW